MRNISLNVLYALAVFPFCASGQEWKTECVGYYQLQLPDHLEVALYPVRDLTNPRKQPMSSYGIQFKRYASPGITFEKTYYRQDIGAVQSQFSVMYYGDYEIEISSESDEAIDFPAYKVREKDDKFFLTDVARKKQKHRLELFKEPLMPENEFNRLYGYLVKDYPNAFSLYELSMYVLYINKVNRLYNFWKNPRKNAIDKTWTVEKEWRDSEPEVLSLLSRFRPRKLYEVPEEQGFCMPYGFIAGDSGHEPRNMAVTYRLKTHPDVTIFFQDLGMKPTAGFIRPENESAKDFVTYLWNRKYQWSAVSKELIRPKWREIKMDEREGLGTFVKSTFKDGSIDYGYVAYVQGDHTSRNEQPDLLLYVMQDSRQAKDQPPMDKDELEKMAEHIVRSVKRR